MSATIVFLAGTFCGFFAGFVFGAAWVQRDEDPIGWDD